VDLNKNGTNDGTNAYMPAEKKASQAEMMAGQEVKIEAGHEEMMAEIRAEKPRWMSI
jgi:hypothetical protein